jgi:RHS repeat-associated protein
MTPAQLTKWRAETTAKTAANEKASATSSTSQPLNASTSGGFYTGKPYLPESGTYAYKYRHYSPEMARWTTVDPSGFPDGANNRLYVNNNSIGNFDPNGKWAVGAAIGAVSSGAIAYASATAHGASTPQTIAAVAVGASIGGVLGAADPTEGVLAATGSRVAAVAVTSLILGGASAVGEAGIQYATTGQVNGTEVAAAGVAGVVGGLATAGLGVLRIVGTGAEALAGLVGANESLVGSMATGQLPPNNAGHSNRRPNE